MTSSVPPSSFSFTSPSPSSTTRQHQHSASSSSPSPSSSFSPSSSPLWSDLQDFVNMFKIPIQQQETKFYANAFEEFKNEFLEAFVEFCTPAYVSYRDRTTGAEETSQETSSSLLTNEERHSIMNDFYRIETYGSYAQETLLNQQQEDDVLSYSSSSSSSMNNCNKNEYDPRSIFRSPHMMMMNNNVNNNNNSNIKTLSSNLDICVFAKNIKTKWIPIIAQSKQMIIDELKRIMNRNNDNNDQDNENKTNNDHNNSNSTELYDKAFLQQLKSKFPHVDLTNASTTFCNNNHHHYNNNNNKQNHNNNNKQSTSSASPSPLRFEDFPELLQKMSRQFIVGDDDYYHDDDENKNNNSDIGEEHSTFSSPLEHHFMNEINLVTNWLHMKIQARATVKWMRMMMMMSNNNNNNMYHSSQSSTMTVLLPHHHDHQENNDTNNDDNSQEQEIRTETGFSSSSFSSPQKLTANDRSSKSQVYSFLTIEEVNEKQQQSNNSTINISELIINVTYSLHPPRAFLISKFCIEPKIQWNPDLKEFIILMKKLLLSKKSSSPPSPYEITLLCMAIYETALLEDDKVTHFEYLRNKQLEQEEERKKAMDDFRFTVSSSPSPAITTTPSSSPSSNKKKKHHDYIDDDDDQDLGGSSSASSAWMKFPSPHSSSSPSSCESYYSLHDILTMTEENRNHINNFSPPQLHRHRHFAECTANITDKLYQSRCRFAVYNTTTSKTSSASSSTSPTTKRHGNNTNNSNQQHCLRPKISLFTLLWNFLKTFCYNSPSSAATTNNNISINGGVEEMTVIFSHEAFYSLCGKAQFSFDDEDENDNSGGSSFIHSSCRILPSEAPVLKTFVMQHLPQLAADDILLNVQQQHEQNISSSSLMSSPTPRIIQQEIIFERNNPEFLTWQANHNTKFDHHQRSRNSSVFSASSSSSSFSSQKYTRFSNIINNNADDDEYTKLLSYEKTISPHLARAFVKYQRHRKMKELKAFGKNVFDHMQATTSSASSSSFSRIASTYQQEPYFSTDEVTTFNWMKLIAEASLCYEPSQPKTTSSNNTSSSLSSLSSLQRTIIETYQDSWFSTYLKHPLIQLRHNLSCNRHIDYYFMMQHYNQKRIPIRIKQCIQRPIRLETPHMGNVLLSVMMMNNNNQQQQSPSSSTTSDNHHHQSLLPNAPCKAPYNNNSIHDHDGHEKSSSLEQRKSVGHLLLHSSSSPPSSSEQEVINVDHLKRDDEEEVVTRSDVVVRNLELNNDNNNDNNHDQEHHPKTAPASVRVSVERHEENDAENNQCNNIIYLQQPEVKKKNELKYFDRLQLRIQQQQESSLSSYFNSNRMPSSIRAPSSSSSADNNNQQNETNNNFRINTPMHDRCDNKLGFDRERSRSPSIRIPFEDDDYLFNNSKNDHHHENKNHFHSSSLTSSLPKSNRSSQRRTVVRFVDIDDDCDDQKK